MAIEFIPMASGTCGFPADILYMVAWLSSNFDKALSKPVAWCCSPLMSKLMDESDLGNSSIIVA
jgi:hypothetical protein